MSIGRFSEGVDAVKDMTEDEISHVSDKLLHDTADGVKKDIADGEPNFPTHLPMFQFQQAHTKLSDIVHCAGFNKYGHHMWNLS
mmetsp:Transcript_41839/g.112067  ORF Transcript_41839/g.112067 Transcript_41839/m.112067 type:complete len:84 (-) Transcript_41839:249-500(-)